MSPLTGDTRARCPRHQPLPRASCPLPGPGDTGGVPCPAMEHHPHRPGLAPTGAGTHWGWCAASWVPEPQVRLPSSAPALGVLVSKRERAGGRVPAVPTVPGEALCLSFPLRDRSAGTGVTPQPRLRDGQ